SPEITSRWEPSSFRERGPRWCIAWPDASVLPGSESTARGHQDSPGTWETPTFPFLSSGVVGARPETPGRLGRRRAEEERRQAHGMVLPSEGNEARREGRRDSERFIVP